MTSNDDTRRTTQGLQGGLNDVHSLPVGSYTAQRLKHASARHLHLTTRRVFIGPIPEAWIAGHRKSWAKYRPRMLTYSSRSATFNAANTVSEFRALTGLDSIDRGQTQGLSFPQPADVNDEEAGDEEEPEAETDAASTKVIVDEPSQDQPEGAPDPVALAPVAAARSADETSFVTALTKQQDAKTFITAKERPGFADQVRMPEGFESPLTSSPEISAKDPESPESNKQDRDPLSRRKRGSSESTQLLLTLNQKSAQLAHEEGSSARAKDKRPDTLKVPINASSRKSSLKKRPSRQHVMLEVAPEAYNDENEQQPDVVHAEPVNTGMIRFELPEEMASKGKKLRSRISEAKESITTRDLRKTKAEPGQLLKAERMLVRIDFTKHELDPNFSERDSAKAETMIIEKWREYMVTCRKSSSENEGFVLHLAKTRVIPMLATERTSKKVAHSVILQPHTTRANFFSVLDKTIVIWEPKRKGTKIYTLRPRSSASSIEWFTFFNLILGWQTPDILRISIPDLDVTMDVDNPLNKQAVLQGTTTEDMQEETAHSQQTNLTDGHVAKYILNKALDALKHSDFHDVLQTWEDRDERLGLVWRQYDRLEWVHGANEERMYGALAMQKTHELEIRTKVHYPTSVPKPGPKHTHETLEEPPPIEGFLVRQTSQKGRDSRFGKNFFKRLYFSTHNHLLCFSEPGKAVPPKPPELVEALEGGTSRAKDLASKIPLIYAVTPYPLDSNDRIAWISNSTLARKKELDQRAYQESERSVHLLLEAEGYIHLCDIKKVRKAKHKKANSPENVHDTHDHDDSESEAECEQEDLQRSFELHLTNGLVVRLQAYDKVARKEWVIRLRELIKYWKLRTIGDIDLYKLVRQQNIDQLGIDEEMESIIGQTAEKWEVSKSTASPELFHMCGISCCRQISMSGTLYRKPRMHSSFKRSVVVLCHGKLLIFQATLRTTSGHERPHILHQREEVVDLKDSYIYSGSLTEDDLLYQNKTFDSNHPGHNALPRVFRDDNWSSVDEDSTTCFVVWHGRRKSLFKANSSKDDGSIVSSVRYVSTLGVPGRSMVFKARSRAERDHWVTNISMEIERLQQSEDVRIVVSK